MKKFMFIIAAAAVALSVHSKDKFAGFYKGTLQGDLHPAIERTLCAEVFHGPDGYRLKLVSQPLARTDVYMVLDGLQALGDRIKFSGEGEYYGPIALEGEMMGGESIKASGRMGDIPVAVDFERVEIVPPTLGEKAPKNAKVLFDGKDTSAWAMNDGGGEINWKLLDGGSMLVANGAVSAEGRGINSSIHTKETFKGPFKLHVEFKIHEMSGAVGQNRGNSGVFIGPYEIQVLDSFGADGVWNDCGALYRQVAPSINASLEPDVWQTFDITYTPAVMKDGVQVKPALFTVWHNGVRVHNESEAVWGTAILTSQRAGFVPPEEVRIELQDHNNAIEYRNIWLEEGS